MPSLEKRISAMKILASRGWKIGLRFDPIIPTCNFSTIYEKLIKDIMGSVPIESIHSVSFGMMRFPKRMFKKIKKDNINSKIFSLPMVNKKGIYSYDEKSENILSKFITKTLKKYIKEEIIYNCEI